MRFDMPVSDTQIVHSCQPAHVFYRRHFLIGKTETQTLEAEDCAHTVSLHKNPVPLLDKLLQNGMMQSVSHRHHFRRNVGDDVPCGH